MEASSQAKESAVMLRSSKRRETRNATVEKQVAQKESIQSLREKESLWKVSLA